jgi:hypothetical protein
VVAADAALVIDAALVVDAAWVIVDCELPRFCHKGREQVPVIHRLKNGQAKLRGCTDGPLAVGAAQLTASCWGTDGAAHHRAAGCNAAAALVGPDPNLILIQVLVPNLNRSYHCRLYHSCLQHQTLAAVPMTLGVRLGSRARSTRPGPF